MDLEPIVAGDHFDNWQPLDDYQPIGQLLQAPCAFADTRTWTLPYNSKLGW